MAALQLAPKDRNLELFVGAALALSVGLAATFLGLDRGRAFYPSTWPGSRRPRKSVLLRPNNRFQGPLPLRGSA